MGDKDRDLDAIHIWGRITTSSSDNTSSAVLRGKHEVEIDEPESLPIGNDQAPCPADYLLVATAGCQVEVLKQALEKARVEEYEIRMDAERQWEEQGEKLQFYPENTRMRHTELKFDLTVRAPQRYEDRVSRCLDICEEACIVSRSVEQGIDITIDKTLEIQEEP